MSVAISVVAAVAVVGGLALAGLTALIVYLVSRRRRRIRYQKALEDARIVHQAGGTVNESELEDYIRQHSRGRSGWGPLGSGKQAPLRIGEKRGKGNDASSRDSALSLARKILTHGAQNASEAGFDKLPSGEASGQQKALCTPDAMRTGYGLGVLVPSTNGDGIVEANEARIARQGYHLPGNPRRWRLLARSDRLSSPRWLFNSSPKPSLGSIKPGSHHTSKDLSRARESLPQETCPDAIPPTPDAIYEACIRLSPPAEPQESRDEALSSPMVTSPLALHTTVPFFDFDSNAVNTENYFSLAPRDLTPRHEGIVSSLDDDIRSLNQRQSRSSTLHTYRSSQSIIKPHDKRSSSRRSSASRRKTSSSLSLSLLDKWQATPRDIQSPLDGKAAKRAEKQQQARKYGLRPLRDPVQPRSPTADSPLANKWLKHPMKRQALRESFDSLNKQLPRSTKIGSKQNLKSKTSLEPAIRTPLKAYQARTGKSSKKGLEASLSVPKSTSGADNDLSDSSISRHSPLLPEVELGHHSRLLGKSAHDSEADLESVFQSISESVNIGSDSESPALWTILAGSNLSVAYPSESHHSVQTDVRTFDDNHRDDQYTGRLLRRTDKAGTESQLKQVRTMSPPQSSDRVPHTGSTFSVSPVSDNSSGYDAQNPSLPIPDSALHPSPPGSPIQEESPSSADTPIFPSELFANAAKSLATDRPRPTYGNLLAYNTLQQAKLSDSQLRAKHQEHSCLAQLVLTPPHKVTRSSSLRDGNIRVPQGQSAPQPPPADSATVSRQSSARMTSMMMTLRRQNSDGSRCDSTYFRLPQNHRVSRVSSESQALHFNTDGVMVNQAGEVIHGPATPKTKDRIGRTVVHHERRRVDSLELKRGVSLSNVGSSTLMSRRSAQKGGSSTSPPQRGRPTQRSGQMTVAVPSSNRRIPVKPSHMPGRAVRADGSLSGRRSADNVRQNGRHWTPEQYRPVHTTHTASRDRSGRDDSHNRRQRQWPSNRSRSLTQTTRPSYIYVNDSPPLPQTAHIMERQRLGEYSNVISPSRTPRKAVRPDAALKPQHPDERTRESELSRDHEVDCQRVAASYLPSPTESNNIGGASTTGNTGAIATPIGAASPVTATAASADSDIQISLSGIREPVQPSSKRPHGPRHRRYQSSLSNMSIPEDPEPGEPCVVEHMPVREMMPLAHLQTQSQQQIDAEKGPKQHWRQASSVSIGSSLGGYGWASAQEAPLSSLTGRLSSDAGGPPSSSRCNTMTSAMTSPSPITPTGSAPGSACSTSQSFDMRRANGGYGGNGVDSKEAEVRRARRESARKRVSELRERVASMEDTNKARQGQAT